MKRPSVTRAGFKASETIECRIEGLAFGGEGVARVEGMVVFVEGGLPGERALVEITRTGKNFLRGRAAEIIEFSADRVTPPCRLFGRCGGCGLQHLRYESQVEWKRKQVLDILARIGGLGGFTCGDAVPSPRPYGYRNSIRLHRFPGRESRYGFYCLDNRMLVEVPRCEIAMDAINAALQGIQKRAQRGPTIDELSLRVDADGLVVVHPGWAAVRSMSGEIGGFRFLLNPASFFQVNTPVAAAIASRLAAWVGAAGGGGTLFDLHCGVGVFPMLLRDRFARVVGIDRDARAIACAMENAAHGTGAECHFIHGEAEQRFGELYDRHAAEGSVALLDPPRGGVEESLVALLAGADRRLGKILYVSCNPATLARDLKRLCAGGAWRLEEAAVFDMFPQTAHVEVCCAIGRV